MNKLKEEFKHFCNKEQDTILVHPKEILDWINQNYISKEEMSKIIEQNRDDMTRLYDYDGIAKDVIELIENEQLN